MIYISMENVTTTKISEAEFAEIKMLQGKFQEMILKFGNLQIEKMELDRMVGEFVENEKTLKSEWTNIQKLEETLMDKIVQKYGNGNLNMVDGSFSPTG
jgi:regulator of replication initiation timing